MTKPRPLSCVEIAEKVRALPTPQLAALMAAIPKGRRL